MYDLTIIGGGWAGFNAALSAKSNGLKVALIEKSHIGGTCLNQGCIPTKSLLQSAKTYNLFHKSRIFGIDSPGPVSIHFSEMQARKDKIVLQLRRNMEFILKGVDIFNREAQVISVDTVKIADKEIKTKYILIASGSEPVELKDLRFDNTKIFSSNQLLQATKIPVSLLVVGGGVIGCEFATLFSLLGVGVTIVELTSQLLPGEDKEIAKKIETSFIKKGIKVKLNTDAASIDLNEHEAVLVCVGRKAKIDNLGLDKIGIKIEKSRIAVNEYLQTDIPTIYAAGDCTGKVMLAHYAAYQGRIAAENIVSGNKPKKADNLNIPNCIFTDPEISSIGLNEALAERQGIQFQTHKFDFLGSAMARILEETEGFIKIIADKNTGRILGASMIGPRVTELISIITTAMQSGLRISELKEVIFPHPSLSEGIHETL